MLAYYTSGYGLVWDLRIEKVNSHINWSKLSQERGNSHKHRYMDVQRSRVKWNMVY